MKVLFVIPRLTGGGAEFVADVWIEWLVSRGHEVAVATTTADAETVERLAKLDCRHIPLGGPKHQLRQLRTLRRELRASAPDVALALQAHPNILLSLSGRTLGRGRRPPLLMSEHNLVSLGLHRYGRRHRLKIWIARSCYRRADHMVAVSHPVAAELVSWFGVASNRCTVVPNPALAKLTSWPAPPRPGTTEGADSVTVVFAGRIDAQKRPLLAVDAVAALRDKGVTARLCVFGIGPLEQQLVDHATARGIEVDLRGWQPDWFRQCPEDAVLLLPSEQEGLGNVLVEAAASGIPSVACSGALGVADAMISGMTGLLVDTADPAELADAILRAHRQGVSHDIGPWLSQFSVESSAGALERLLDRVAARAG